MTAALTMTHAIPTHENGALVAISVAVAIIASYLALDLAQRSAGTYGWARRIWIAAGGVTIGLGIWSMHFVGMLALQMAMPASYELALVALSMFVAIAGSVIALAVVTRPDTSYRGLFAAAGFLGLAVAAMHYLGMASMQMDATIDWNVWLVAASLAIAFGAALAALFMVMQLGRSRFRLGFARRAGAALILGLGIAGLHYTAMAAATFRPTMAGMAMGHGDFGAGGLVVLLAIGAGVMLAILIGGGAVDQRRAAAATDLALVAGLARGLSTGEGTRERACAAVLELSGADFVFLIQPGDDRTSQVVATAGLEQQVPADAVAGEGQMIDAIGERGGSTFLAELPQGAVLAQYGAIAAFYEPLVLDRQPIGLFALAYRSRRRRVGERSASLLGMLATEAALAIDREDLIARLDFMARRDELTGLVNRRVLRETLDTAVSRAAESGTVLSLAILDLDSFKEVNDRSGHQAGDRLLRAASAAWASTLRDTDTIGRYGGDEFVVVLPGLAGEASAAAIERLRQATPGGATCSAGVATWDGEQSATQLIAAADSLLYGAKESGRDRTAALTAAALAAGAEDLPTG